MNPSQHNLSTTVKPGLFRLFALAVMATLVPNFTFANTHNDSDHHNTNNMGLETATFAGGCFWCTEAVFENIDGVKSVVSGYMGGETIDPTYEEICKGDTGHAEVIQLEFDPSVVSFEELVDVFWQAHDPTTLNRQGADIGTQYRSVIFYHSEEQKQTAAVSLARAQADFKDPIVTEITEAGKFYKAEGYHQDFYSNNKSYPYCRVVITPKLKKLGMAK